MKKYLISFLAICSFQFLIGCGVSENDDSVLFSPASVIHRFNNIGGNGFTGKWNTLPENCNPIPKEGGGTTCLHTGPQHMPDGSVKLPAWINSEICYISGPKLNFRPGPSGLGHVHAQVDLVPEAAALAFNTALSQITVELVSHPNGSTILDRKTVQYRQGDEPFTVTLSGGVFENPIRDLEVKVCKKECVPGQCGFLQTPGVISVKETRIVYN